MVWFKAQHVDKPTISPVIPHIGQQIRLSLTFAKSLADLQVFIFQRCPAAIGTHLFYRF